MSSKYVYANGAIHNDHHKEMNISLSDKADICALMKSFFAEDATDAEVVETEEEVSSEESETEASDDFIFRDALDMPKVKEALSEVLTRKDKSGKLIFSQKNLVYVVYKFFMENDWLEKNNQTKFREWMCNNFGEDFRCGKTHFDGVDRIYKTNSISQWKSTWTPYVTAAHALTEHFMGKDNPQWEKAFLKPNRYIAHGTKKVK